MPFKFVYCELSQSFISVAVFFTFILHMHKSMSSPFLRLFQHCAIEYSKFDTEMLYQPALIVKLMTNVALVGHYDNFHSIKTDLNDRTCDAWYSN